MFATFDGTAFKFYTELTREKLTTFMYRNLGIVEWSNFALCLRVLQSHVIILACTRLLALRLYLCEHIYVNCSVRHRTDSMFVLIRSLFTLLETVMASKDVSGTNCLSILDRDYAQNKNITKILLKVLAGSTRVEGRSWL